MKWPRLGGLGSWTFAVDMPSAAACPSQSAAPASAPRQSPLALQSDAAYLFTWLQAKTPEFEASHAARYCDHVRKDLIPVLGTLKPEKLTH
jgi:hypothetical protein